MIQNQTLVSIGMPVYNGENTLRKAISSLLEQTYKNIELIISDNASSDGTEAICREYAAKDKRVRYFRQLINLGGEPNFKFVFDEAHGEYFMWAAGDDLFSTNFIEINQKFLSENHDYVASTSPTGFADKPIAQQQLVDFTLDGNNVFDRYIKFFDYCGVSHGIFYSLIRADVLRGCEILDQSYFAVDWAINLYLVSKGKVHRTLEGYAIFGVEGISRSPDAYKAFRRYAIDILLPFYSLAGYMNKLDTNFTLSQRTRILFILTKLNILAGIDQFSRKLSFLFIKN